MSFPNPIVLHDVGMRDGLQMESRTAPFDVKIRWIDLLMDAGVDAIQIGSFVHPDKVPQMADTDRLFRHYRERGKSNPDTILSGLILNERGFERGLSCGVELFCMGVSASETHSMKNTGMTVDDATKRIIALAKSAQESGARVQVSVQSAFGCGFEGKVAPERVWSIVDQYLSAGLRIISMADTAGHATPAAVERMFTGIFERDNDVRCTCHFHNTYGLGLANCYAAMRLGVNSFETSFAGLGGCPFTKVAAGNVCTEDFLDGLHRDGLRTDIRIDPLIRLAREAGVFFDREMPGLVHKIGNLKSDVGHVQPSHSTAQ